MRRLKDVSVFFLTLILGLCVISTPALADWPWALGPPMIGKGDADDLPGPRGGSSLKVVPSNTVETLSYPILMTEISYRLAEFWVDYTKIVQLEQFSPKEAKSEPTKVD